MKMYVISTSKQGNGSLKLSDKQYNELTKPDIAAIKWSDASDQVKEFIVSNVKWRDTVEVDLIPVNGKQLITAISVIQSAPATKSAGGYSGGYKGGAKGNPAKEKSIIMCTVIKAVSEIVSAGKPTEPDWKIVTTGIETIYKCAMNIQEANDPAPIASPETKAVNGQTKTSPPVAIARITDEQHKTLLNELCLRPAGAFMHSYFKQHSYKSTQEITVNDIDDLMKQLLSIPLRTATNA